MIGWRCPTLIMISRLLDVRSVRRTAFLLIDPLNFVDLVDYWNLRAFGWRVLPVPLTWAASITSTVSDLLERHFHPIPALRGDLTSAWIIKGRSVDPQEFQEFVQGLSTAKERFIVQTWIPRYWRRDCWDSDLVERPGLCAREHELEQKVESRKVSFRTLPPVFGYPYQGSNVPQWANVVQVRSWELPELAEVIPRDLDGISETLAEGFDSNSYRCGSKSRYALAFPAYPGAGHSSRVQEKRGCPRDPSAFVASVHKASFVEVGTDECPAHPNVPNGPNCH